MHVNNLNLKKYTKFYTLSIFIILNFAADSF